MKHVIAALLALICFAAVSPAEAYMFHGTPATGSASPLVSPGASQPSLNTTSGIISASYNTITASSHGNPADHGYAIRGGFHWDAIPFVEVGRPGVSGTMHFGFQAWHVPTTTDMAAGLTSNISSAKVRCDGGAWYTITGPSANPDADGVTNWNFTVTSGPSWPDGLHKCDVLASPSTGPDLIADGPAADPYGTGLEQFKVSQAIISDGTGLNPGTVLTVPAAINNGNDVTILSWRGGSNSSAALGVGQSVSLIGSAPNTFISSLGTGTGRDGTYNVTGGAQLAVGWKGTASITGSVLQVTGTTAGAIQPTNNFLFGAGVPADTYSTAPLGTGSISGTTLTITAIYAPGRSGFGANLPLLGTGVTSNTTIVGDAYTNSGACSPACTGSGGVGTYAVSTSQTVTSTSDMHSYSTATNGTGNGYYPLSTASTVASTTMTASAPAMIANARSFYFLTNYNGTLNRPIVYASLSGSDSNDGLSAATPVLTIGAAEQLVRNNGSSTGIYGGVICLMGGGTFTYTGPINPPRAIAGQLVFQSANQAPCNAPGDPGGATADHNTGTPRQYFGSHNLWRYVNFNGKPDDGNGGAGQYLSADHVTQVHDLMDKGGVLGQGGAYCVGSTGWFGQDGICSGAMLVRANNAKFFSADAQHDVTMTENTTFDYGGNIFKWVTGTTTPGSNVITNVTFTAPELSGYSLSSIFANYANINVVQAGTEGGGGTPCFTGTWPIRVTAVDDVNHTLTVLDYTNNPPTAVACTNAKLYSVGAHSDLYQVSVTNPFGDIYVVGNSWGATAPGYQQGEFLETPQMSGGYVVNNLWGTDPTVAAYSAQTKGGNENIINANNTYNGGNGVAWNVQQPSDGDTLIKDQCAGVAWSFRVAGTNQRSNAAASNACYATAP